MENVNSQWHKVNDSNGMDIIVNINDKTDSYSDEFGSAIIQGYVLINNQPVDAEQILKAYTQAGSIDALYAKLSGQFWIFIKPISSPATVFGDHIGMEPCYYFHSDSQLIVSSSLKSIKHRSEMKLTLSKQAVYNYIYFHCIPSPTTIYENVYKLESGKSVSFLGKTKTSSLLYCPDFAEQLNDSNDAHQECLNTIEQAVSCHAKGEVGAFLSGGLDSSTVAGMLAKTQNGRAKTFSIGFEVRGYDETEYALITAKHFNTDHQVLYLKPEEAAAEFVNIAQYFDEPFGNSSAMAAFYCAKFAKQHGVDVLLAGDGGDELFAGNERYAKQKVFEKYYCLPSWLGSIINIIFNNHFTRAIPGLKKVASYLTQARVKLPMRLQNYNFLTQLGVENIFHSDMLSDVDLNMPEQQLKQRYGECKSSHPVDAMLYLDWKFTLADNDLIKVGKMCELAGVEVRYPLLDKQIVDFSCSIPADIKLPGSALRDFYKKSCKGFLADETLNKTKHGFGLPFGAWMKENKTLKDLTTKTLNQFKQRNIVKNSLIEQALNAHNSIHTSYYGELIWIMVVLELWLQKEEPDFCA